MVGLRTVLLCAVLWAGCVQCFNVDTENYIKHTGKAGSMFGFSVAQHRDRGTSWVLVGAPEAQTGQPGVSRGGAVFRCDVNRNDACQEVPFDVTGNSNNSQGTQLDKKSDQWFGATVVSSGADGVIMACAPRYVWFNTRLDMREPVGTCYIAKNSFSEFSEYSPCRTRNWGYHRQGSCQVGLGASISKDGDRLYIGAVGSYYWQGSLLSVSSKVRMVYNRLLYEEFGTGQLISQSLSSRLDVIQTRQGPPLDDDSYLGYSVVAGDFDGSGEPGAAVGMPRGHNLTGKVVLYSWNLKNTLNITGDQIGGYFGYSICSSDVDGDGLDDLIIGAPMYTAKSENNEMKYETGRIYVVYQSTEEKFKYYQTRDGINSKARFGLSVANLGDINKDGYGDFAVGAPYDGPNERGTVYIYHGSKEGVMEKASQVIYAEDIRPELSTFGFSVSGGLDLDENEYPDIVVGAYESETAVFLRSRPVIKMTASLLFGAQSKLISLKERNCTTKEGVKVSCIQLKGCMEYNGTGVDQRLNFEIQFLLDSKKSRDVRLFFLDHEGRYSQNYSVTLEKSKQFCKTETVYIKSSIRDKLTPLEAELRYSVRTAGGLAGGSSVSSGSRRVSRSLKPILDQNVAAVQKDSINIEKNCGKDNICIPDLKLISTPSVKQYLLGSGQRFEIDVFVENNGEDAYEAMYNLQIPPGMNYNKIERFGDPEREIPVQCSAPSPATNNTLRCDIGNPLPKRKVVHFKVQLSPFHRVGMKPRYEFFMEVNTTNPENKSSTLDNVQTLSIPIWVQTDHIVTGVSKPTDVPYNMSQFRSENVTREAQIGPQVVHIYSIKNQGPAHIVQAEAFFVWPSHTQEDDELLYLMEQPETNGQVRCEFVSSANARNIQIDTKNKKSHLELHGVAVDSTYSSGVSIEKSSTSSSSKSTSSSSSSFSSSSSSSSGGTHIQSNTGQGYDRNEIIPHSGVHAMSEEERRLFELAKDDRRKEQSESGRQIYESGSTSSQSSSSGVLQGGNGRVQDGGATAQGGRDQNFGSTRTEVHNSQSGSGVNQGGNGASQGGGGVSYQGGFESTRTEVYGSQSGSAVNQGGHGTVQGGGVTHQLGRDQSFGSTRTEEYSSQGGSGVNQGSYGSVQGGGYRNQGGRTGSDGSVISEEHSSHRGGGGWVVTSSHGSADGRGYGSQGGAGGQDSYGSGSIRVYGEGSNIPVEEGAYLGSRVRGGGGLTKLEQDYQSFGTTHSNRERERERQRERAEWRNNQANRAEWRAIQEGRGNTDEYGSGGSRTYGYGGLEGHNTRESRVNQSGGGDSGYSWSSRTHSQGSSGDYDAQGRTYSQGGDYSAGGSRHYNQGSSGGSSSSSSRNFIRGGSGDFSAGGTRIYNQDGSGINHEQYGSLGGGGHQGGYGGRTAHESRNVTVTYSEDGGAPRTFSNFSFSNTSSGGRNISGSWQTGEDLSSISNLGNIGAGHSGSHESVSHTSNSRYGNARETRLERHGESGVSRSGYNIGNPSSAERSNWSMETRTHSGGSTGTLQPNNEGLSVYNWTSQVNNFGSNNDGGGRRTEGGHSWSTSSQWSSDNDGRSTVNLRQEPDERRTYARRESQTVGQEHGGHSDRDQTDSRNGKSSSFTSESSSSKTHFEGVGAKSRYVNAKEATGGNTLVDVDSKFPLYKRFERSVSDLINLDDKDDEELRNNHRRSIETEDRWDRDQNDEGYPTDSVARQASDSELERMLDCTVTKCTRMKCLVGPLKKDEEVHVALRYRVWVRTLEKIGWNRPARLSTLMAARVTELPHVGEPFEMKLKTSEVPVDVFPTDVPVRPDIVPLWVVVLSACAGAIILLLLIFLLYKCGFFKRNRPTDSAEKEPLNRNGNYNSGDEAL